MADTKISVQGQKPAIKSYEDFDVFQGGAKMSRSEMKESTFHSGSQTDGDPVFNAKAELMEGTGAELEGIEEKGESEEEKKEESEK